MDRGCGPWKSARTCPEGDETLASFRSFESTIRRNGTSFVLSGPHCTKEKGERGRRLTLLCDLQMGRLHGEGVSLSRACSSVSG